LLQPLQNAALRGVIIRILLSAENKKKDDTDHDYDHTIVVVEDGEPIAEQQLKEIGIDIKQSKKHLENKFSMLIVDQSLSLTVDLKESPKGNLEDSMGLVPIQTACRPSSHTY
jgi:hypothetical protein